jgi:hypothetical protein
VSYLLADKCIFKWIFKAQTHYAFEAQPHYAFTTKPAPQANLDTSEDLPKKTERSRSTVSSFQFPVAEHFDKLQYRSCPVAEHFDKLGCCTSASLSNQA